MTNRTSPHYRSWMAAAAALALLPSAWAAGHTLALDGTWRYELDRQDQGLAERWHRPRLGVISESNVFAGNSHEVLDPERCRGKNVCLEGQSVPVAAAHLKNALNAVPLKKRAPAQGTGFQNRVRHFRDDDGIQASSGEIGVRGER